MTLLADLHRGSVPLWVPCSRPREHGVPRLQDSLGHAHEAVSMAPKSLEYHHLRCNTWGRGGDQRGVSEKWQMAEDLRSSARLSWIMFRLPCSPQYHVVRESVEGSHRIAACRGDHGRHEPDREMECGNALDCWCQLFLPALPSPARGSRQAMAGLGALSGLRPAVLTPRAAHPAPFKKAVGRPSAPGSARLGG